MSALSRITGIACSTIGRGLAELRDAATDVASGRVRRAGGGRAKLTSSDATLLGDLRELAEPATRGDPQAPLLWPCNWPVTISLRREAPCCCVMG